MVVLTTDQETKVDVQRSTQWVRKSVCHLPAVLEPITANVGNGDTLVLQVDEEGGEGGGGGGWGGGGGERGGGGGAGLLPSPPHQARGEASKEARGDRGPGERAVGRSAL